MACPDEINIDAPGAQATDGTRNGPAAPPQDDKPPADDQRLGRIAGLTLPVIAPSDFFDPIVLALLITLMLCRFASPLAPDEETAEIIWQWNFLEIFLSSFFESVSYLYFGVSLRVLVFATLTYVPLAWLSQLFMDTNAFAFPATLWIILPWAAICKFQGQWCLFVACQLGGASIVFGVYYLLRNLKIVLDLIDNSFVQGIIPPLLSTALCTVYPTIVVFIYREVGRRGVMSYALGSSITYSQAAGSGIKLVGLMCTAKDPVTVCGALTSMMFSDVFGRLPVRQCIGRLPIMQRLARLPGVGILFPEVVDSETDCYMRLRFSTSYVPVLPAAAVAGLAAAAGAPWPLEAAFWCGLLVYVVYSAGMDVLLVALHRARYPAEPAEPIWATAARLATQPRANWPKHQDQAPVAAAPDLWAPSCLESSRPRCANDRRAVAFQMTAYTYVFIIAAFSSFYSECYIWTHAESADCV